MCSKVVIDIMQKRSEMVRVRVRISKPIRGTVGAGLHRMRVGKKKHKLENCLNSLPGSVVQNYSGP